jgi:hypothetical protein
MRDWRLAVFQLASTMVDFDCRFEVMPGTKLRPEAVAHASAYCATQDYCRVPKPRPLALPGSD